MTDMKTRLIEAARVVAGNAHAPYSGFGVGAAVLLEDGEIVSGCNFENASYGLTLCAETVAAARAMNEGRRGGLIAVAIVGGSTVSNAGDVPATVTPCGRCRQVLAELASLDEADPVVWCGGGAEVLELQLSALLPFAFGPANLRDKLQG